MGGLPQAQAPGGARGLLIRLALAALLLCSSTAAAAKPYLALRAGTQYWGDSSNGDALESGAQPGTALGLAVGDEAGLSDVGLPKSDFALDLELEGTWRREALHGRNRGDEHRSADGREIDVLTAGANLWPGWQLTPQWTVYAGGGGGLALARALGDSELAPFFQVGGGIRWNLTPSLSFELAQRSVWLERTRHDDYRASYGSHGGWLGVRWEFGKGASQTSD